jgi:molybdopterin-containing oxidoreductase family membrane subunit
MSQSKKVNWPLYGWVAVIVAGMLIGLWGAATLLITGHAATGTSDQVPWGIFVPTYVFFVAASAGCVIVSLGFVFGVKSFEFILKRAVFLAIATLVAGGIIIILDLGSPQTIFNFFLSPNLQSPMWWMSIFYALFLILLLIQFYLIHKGNLKRINVIIMLTALVAIAEHSTLGALFGFAAVRTFFGGVIAPLYFLVISTVIGIALLLFVTILQFKASRREMSTELRSLVVNLGKFLGIAVGVIIVFTLWKDLGGVTSTLEGTALAYQHVSSTWWYWVVVILIGLIVPVFLLFHPSTRNPNGILAASVLVLIGMFSARIEFTIGGQLVPVIQDLKHLQSPFGNYSVTFVEAAVVILAFAVSALLYTLGMKKLALE